MSHITTWVFPEPCSHGKHPIFTRFRQPMGPKTPVRSPSFFFRFFCQTYSKFKGLNLVVRASLVRQLNMFQILDAKMDQILHPIFRPFWVAGPNWPERQDLVLWICDLFGEKKLEKNENLRGRSRWKIGWQPWVIQPCTTGSGEFEAEAVS
jgi:hypothetical protein